MKSVVVDTDVISFALKGDTRFQLYAPELRDRLLIASFMTVAESFLITPRISIV